MNVVLSLIGGLALLTVGGEMLVRGAAALALRLGLTPLIVGLTVVAFGTSSPELAVSVDAALTGLGDIAVGNVVGSNLFNILGILGIAALVSPMELRNIAWTDLGAMIAVASILLPMIGTGRTLSRTEGGLLLIVYAAYTSWLFVAAGTATG